MPMLNKIVRFIRFQVPAIIILLVVAGCFLNPAKAQGFDTTFTVQRTETPYPFDLIWKAKWKEGKKVHVMLLSRESKTGIGEGFEVVFGRHFVKRGKKWNLTWAYTDTVQGYGCDLELRLMRDFCEVKDADQDGIREVYFLYLENNRCDAVTVDTKLVVNEGNVGGEIKGVSELYLGPTEEVMNRFLREMGEPEMRYKDIQPNLEAMGPAITEHASQLWDALLKWQDVHQGE